MARFGLVSGLEKKIPSPSVSPHTKRENTFRHKKPPPSPLPGKSHPPARSLCVATASVHRSSSVLHCCARHSRHVEEVIISGSSFQFRFHFESTFNICSVVCFKQWEVWLRVLLSDRVVLFQVRTQLL